MTWLSKIEPNDIHSEQRLIAGLVSNPSLMADVLYLISHSDFHYPFFRHVFFAIEGMWLSGDTITADSIVSRIGSNGGYEEQVGLSLRARVEGLFRWFEHNQSSTDLLDVDATYIRGFALTRHLIGFAHDILDRAYDKDDLPENTLERASTWLCAIKEWEVEPKAMRARFESLHSMPYGDYLRSPEWKARRDAQVKIDGNACRVCASPDNLNVHHRTYERRGCEAPGDLITLCQPCHQLFHDNGKLAKADM